MSGLYKLDDYDDDGFLKGITAAQKDRCRMRRAETAKRRSARYVEWGLPPRSDDIQIIEDAKRIAP